MRYECLPLPEHLGFVPLFAPSSVMASLQDDDTISLLEKLTLDPSQSNTARRRLVRDFKSLSRDPPSGVSGAPCSDNILLWNAVIFGPRTSAPADDHGRADASTPIIPPGPPNTAETPFEDGTFRLVLTFEETYPNRPPTVKFM